MKAAGLCLALTLFSPSLISTTLMAHDGPHPRIPVRTSNDEPVRPATPPASEHATTGSGEYQFRRHELDLPAPVRENLVRAHGGFAVDRESEGGDGSTYFGLKGVGLLRLLPDLSGLEIIGGEPVLSEVNLHNAAVFRRDGVAYLALPSDEGQRIFITTLRGELVRDLPNPYGSEPAFRVCDVDLVDDRLIAVNGYADNVCFAADLKGHHWQDPRQELWTTIRFGGGGKLHGQFGTAHGVTRVPGTNTITIADRANARLETYTRDGQFIATLPFEPGTKPCDVDYLGALSVVGCLEGPGGTKPAPVYVHENGNRVAELNPGRDLGLATFQHIHNAALRRVPGADGDGRLFVLVYAWNPGDLVILERLPAPKK